MAGRSRRRIRVRQAAALALACALGAPGAAQASDDGDLDQLLDLDLQALMDVPVLSASRTPQRLEDAPANVIVVTRETIERRGYRTLEEVLADLPGFDIIGGQPAGEFPTHIAIRGLHDVGQTKMLVMIDDIIVNDVSNGWSTNLGFDFHFDDVERIEVVSGPGSALYGANAYVGIINIITSGAREGVEGEEGLLLRAALAYGSHMTVSPRFVVGYKLANGLALQLSGRWLLTRGDDGARRPDPGGYFTGNLEPDMVLTLEHGEIPNERNPDGSRKALPDGFGTDVNDISIRLLVQKDDFELGGGVWRRLEGLGSEVVGYEYFTNTGGLDYRARHAGYHAFARYRTDLGERVRLKTWLYHRGTSVLKDTSFVYTYQYQSVDNGVDPPTEDLPKAYSGSGHLTGLETLLDADLVVSERFANQAVVGFRLERQIRQYYGISLGTLQSDSSTIVGSTFDSGETTVQPVFLSTGFALFLQDEQRLGERYRLSAGVRLDLDTEVNPVVNPRLALVGQPIGGLSFKLLYGSAFKSPTVFELFDEWRGNDGLEPQRIQTGELQLRYAFGKVAALQANAFLSRATDIITERPNPDPQRFPVGPAGQRATFFQNVGATTFGGFTLAGELLFDAAGELRAWANWSWLWQDRLDAIDNIAVHKLNVGVDWLILRHVDLSVRANWVGRTRAPQTNRYYHPKDAAFVAASYDYVTASDPDGWKSGSFVTHLAVTGKNLFGESLQLEPRLIVRNVFDVAYTTIGRQSGSGTRPVDQPIIRNPAGFSPPYHPMPRFEIFAELSYRY